MKTRIAPIKFLALASAVGIGFAPGAMAQGEEVAPEMDATEATEEVVPEMDATEPAAEDVAQTPGDIIDVASSADDFSTLVTAIEAADLVEPLQGEGPFTVFAPTNDAFDALPEGVLDALLLPENQDLLTEVLTYHVVPGEFVSGDLSTGPVETLNGEDVAVTVDDDMVMVEEADVVAADVLATNGVIHVIDEVLVPESVVTELESRLAATEAEPMVEEPMVEEPAPAEPMVEEPAPAEPVRGLW